MDYHYIDFYKLHAVFKTILQNFQKVNQSV